MRKYLVGAVIAAVFVIAASAIAGRSGSNNGDVVEGVANMTPIAIVGQDGGYTVTVGGTVTTTQPAAAFRVEGQDGGYPVAVNGGANVSSAYGQVLILNSAATAIPTTGLAGRRWVLIQNNHGSNAIRCGTTSGVTTATGIALAANGGAASFDCNDVACTIFCISVTADQTSTTPGTATNYIEGK